MGIDPTWHQFAKGASMILSTWIMSRNVIPLVNMFHIAKAGAIITHLAPVRRQLTLLFLLFYDAGGFFHAEGDVTIPNKLMCEISASVASSIPTPRVLLSGLSVANVLNLQRC